MSEGIIAVRLEVGTGNGRIDNTVLQMRCLLVGILIFAISLIAMYAQEFSIQFLVGCIEVFGIFALIRIYREFVRIRLRADSLITELRGQAAIDEVLHQKATAIAAELRNHLKRVVDDPVEQAAIYAYFNTTNNDIERVKKEFDDFRNNVINFGFKAPWEDYVRYVPAPATEQNFGGMGP